MKAYKYTHIKARVQTPYPSYDQNGQNQIKLIPFLWPRRLKLNTITILWSRTYLYSPYKGVPPSGLSYNSANPKLPSGSFRCGKNCATCPYISPGLITYTFFSTGETRPIKSKGSRDGAVVRALASHRCGPGSIPAPGVTCGLSVLLVLVPAPRVFFSGFSGFSPSTKINISKF